MLYYHPDHLGSTQYVTDQDQQLSQHVEYLPTGELWTDQTDSRFQNRQPYLFNGKELDLSTWLYHYGARSYDHGRILSAGDYVDDVGKSLGNLLEYL
ncbi:hypothetical protein BE20_32740 [Sorangium cellulosum]|uniref:Uncharacterized protein n=1 Tax=Sorangium cellulosum TaxID=56 RepID=A0A150T384_SORCE|nr:hypothetical protein BE18_05450 [Sorangium cellulosum]KYF99103.1 hypothetical protein BE20_32740 [Sorangium cellulosum]